MCTGAGSSKAVHFNMFMSVIARHEDLNVLILESDANPSGVIKIALNRDTHPVGFSEAAEFVLHGIK